MTKPQWQENVNGKRPFLCKANFKINLYICKTFSIQKYNLINWNKSYNHYSYESSSKIGLEGKWFRWSPIWMMILTELACSFMIRVPLKTQNNSLCLFHRISLNFDQTNLQQGQRLLFAYMGPLECIPVSVRSVSLRLSLDFRIANIFSSW